MGCGGSKPKDTKDDPSKQKDVSESKSSNQDTSTKAKEAAGAVVLPEDKEPVIPIFIILIWRLIN